MQEKDILTYSAISMAQQCMRRFKLRYVDGLIPKKKDSHQAFGTVVHKALEIAVKEDLDAAIEYIKTTYMREFLDPNTQTDHLVWIHRAEAMALGLIENYPWKFKVTCPEKLVLVEYDNPRFNLAGKIDGFYEKDGMKLLLDYKTISREDKQKSILLQDRHFQAKMYMYLMDLLGSTYDGLTIIPLKKCSLKQGKLSSEAFAAKIYKDYCDPKRRDFYFPQPMTTYRSRMDEFAENLRFWIQRIQVGEEVGHFPLSESSCSGFSVCPWISACLEEPGWEDNFTKHEPYYHRELDESAEIEEDEVPYGD